MATIALPQPEGKTTQELNREVAEQKKRIEQQYKVLKATEPPRRSLWQRMTK